MNWLDDVQIRCDAATRCGPDCQAVAPADMHLALSLLREALALLGDAAAAERKQPDWVDRRDALLAAAEKGPG